MVDFFGPVNLRGRVLDSCNILIVSRVSGVKAGRVILTGVNQLIPWSYPLKPITHFSRSSGFRA